MLHHLSAGLVLVLLLLLGLADLRKLFPFSEPQRPVATDTPRKPPPPLRLRSPEDCPDCRRAPLPSSSTVAASVPPWRAGKSRRGRRKTLNTDGYAGPNPDCQYHSIRDANVHALIGYGHPGQRERIQDLFCQACRRQFSVRRHTALYHLKTEAARVSLVLMALAEGLSISGAMHTFGHRERTIVTWLRRAGTHAERLHGQLFRNLQLLEVQLDELSRDLSDPEVGDRRAGDRRMRDPGRTTLRNTGQEVWIWIACDAKTKVIAAVQMGPRTSRMVTTIGM
jgi:hypothetical protein